jgi:diguanylate cyclase
METTIMTQNLNKQHLQTVSARRSADILRLVIPQISKHNLAATPINYTVWYEYYLASNLQLKQAIDKKLENGNAFSNESMKSFFDSYIAAPNTDAVKQAQEEVLRIIATLSETAQSTDSNASDYHQSLQFFTDQLESPTASQELPNILSNLVAETQSMQLSLQTMRNNMDESQQEINELRSKLDQITAEALTDPLTGLANRKGFAIAFEKTLELNKADNSSISLIMVDIDHFKKVNDTHGHLVGDKVIKYVADTLTKQIRDQDTASRFGGEEYAVLLPNTSLNAAQAIAETIRKKIEIAKLRRTNTQEPIGQITVSSGIASLQANEPLDSLIDRADTALYISKQNGRNRVTVDQ